MTEFSLAVARIEDLEALLQTPNADGGAAAPILASIDESLLKFDKRIKLQIYGEKMIGRVDGLRTRAEAVRSNVESLVAKSSAIAAEEAAAKEVAKMAAEAAAAQAAKAAEVIATQKAAAKEAAAKAAAAKEATAKEAAAAADMSPPPAKVARVDPSVPSPLKRQKSGQALARGRSYRVSQLSHETVGEMASRLGLKANESLTREQAEKLLTALVLARLAGPVEDDDDTRLRDLRGWQRWAKLEAQAGFLLMDTDGSKTIEFDEFVSFVATSPQIFGPLATIEQLFDVYDLDKDGTLDADEIHCLHLEVALEHETANTDGEEGGPSFDDMMDTVRQLAAERAQKTMRLYASGQRKDSPHGTVSFSSFVRAVYDDPSLLGTAANLRRTFATFDTDGSGALERDELREMIRHYESLNGVLYLANSRTLDAYVDAAMAQADTNGDGTIDFPEFMRFASASETSLKILPSAVPPTAAIARLGGSEASGSAGANGIDVLGQDSFLARLMRDQGNSLGLTDPAKPSIAACATCGAPLVGKSMGVCSMGLDFCDATCVSKKDGLIERRSYDYARMTGSHTLHNVKRLNEAAKEDFYSRGHRSSRRGCVIC